MENQTGGAGRLLAITLLLIVAVGALALFRFDIAGARTWLMGTHIEPENTPPGPRPLPGTGPGQGQTPEEVAFDAKVPSSEGLRVVHPTPLPETLTISRKVGPYSVDMDLVLVPQGWFIMGEDDVVDSNRPKRWVWCSDFYVARTEVTNAQYFAFILDNGYLRSQFWTQEGFQFARDAGMNGSELLGWKAMEQRRRAWWLAAPDGDVTIELRNEGGAPPRVGAPVLVLPTRGEWNDWLSVDTINQKVFFKIRGQWMEVTGEDIVKEPRLLEMNAVRLTDVDGRVHIPANQAGTSMVVMTWPDGNRERPAGGNLLRIDSRLTGPRLPVVSVTWFEADACARYWGGQLPRESWWEKAARGTDGRHFPWGDDLELTFTVPSTGRLSTPRANFNRTEVEEVGRYSTGASPYRVLDMVGNVSEWTADAWVARLLADPRYEGADPRIMGSPRDRRTERGTSFSTSDPQSARVYTRFMADPSSDRNRHRGFRVAFSAEEALRAARRAE